MSSRLRGVSALWAYFMMIGVVLTVIGLATMLVKELTSPPQTAAKIVALLGIKILAVGVVIAGFYMLLMRWQGKKATWQSTLVNERHQYHTLWQVAAKYLSRHKWLTVCEIVTLVGTLVIMASFFVSSINIGMVGFSLFLAGGFFAEIDKMHPTSTNDRY